MMRPAPSTTPGWSRRRAPARCSRRSGPRSPPFDRLKDAVGLRNEKTDWASADEVYIELANVESSTSRVLSRCHTLNDESEIRFFERSEALVGKSLSILKNIGKRLLVERKASTRPIWLVSCTARCCGFSSFSHEF